MDAADIEEVLGAIRWIALNEIEGMSASTQALTRSMLASYLRWELNCDVSLLGIQPELNEVGETISLQVSVAIRAIAQELTVFATAQSVP